MYYSVKNNKNIYNFCFLRYFKKVSFVLFNVQTDLSNTG